jgi:hypothetical protein
MDTAHDDIAALRSALEQAQARAADADAEAARAVAQISSTEALTASLRLEIEKLRREIYGQRSLVASSRQRCSSRNSSPEFLQRLAVDPGDNAGDRPARLAHLNDGDQRAILIQSGERSAQVIRLWHRALHRLSPRRWRLVLAARPIASLEPVDDGDQDVV